MSTISTKYILTLLLLAGINSSCNWAKEKTKQTVHKTGEIVAETGSEFVDGVSKGIQKSFDHEIQLPDNMKQQGLELGKVVISSEDQATDNVLSVYFIFNANFNKQITIRAITEQGQEFGRATQLVTGNQGEAKYIDFIFDKRTNIDGKATLAFSAPE